MCLQYRIKLIKITNSILVSPILCPNGTNCMPESFHHVHCLSLSSFISLINNIVQCVYRVYFALAHAICYIYCIFFGVKKIARFLHVSMCYYISCFSMSGGVATIREQCLIERIQYTHLTTSQPPTLRNLSTPLQC